VSVTATLISVDLPEVLACNDDPAALGALFASYEQTPAALALDKTWHAIHYLLTGSIEETEGVLASAIFGGRVLGDEESQARLLMPDEVADLSHALIAIPPEELLRRYNADELNDAGVYFNSWSASNEDTDYVRDYYRSMIEFYRTAARDSKAVIILIIA
jgi:hypothetical protein